MIQNHDFHTHHYPNDKIVNITTKQRKLTMMTEIRQQFSYTWATAVDEQFIVSTNRTTIASVVLYVTLFLKLIQK